MLNPSRIKADEIVYNKNKNVMHSMQSIQNRI